MELKDGFIQIFVKSKTRNFTYLPAVYHAKANSSITWIANGNWAAQFYNGTPLKEGTSLSASKGVELKTTVTDVKGVYHFAVAVEIGGEVFLDAGCPTIIID